MLNVSMKVKTKRKDTTWFLLIPSYGGLLLKIFTEKRVFSAHACFVYANVQLVLDVYLAVSMFV
jgi:hypothetical protein